MNWAIKRQLTYFSIIFAIVLLVAVYFVYKIFFSAPASCFDRKQNQDERGIDCGGSCQLVCIEDSRDLIVRWAQAVPVTDDVYNVVAYVENQNVSAGVPSIDYEFKVYDDRNILISERTGRTFIEPNQRTAIFEASLPVGRRIPRLTQFSFTQSPIWLTTDELFRKKLLTIEDETWSQLDTSPKLTARVRNANIFDIRDAHFIVIVSDAMGNAIGSSATIVDIVPQGGWYDISFTWPKSFSDKPVRTEIIPRVNPFQQEI